MTGINCENIFEAAGCKLCHETGYRRRTGIFDILVVDDRLKARIAKKELSVETLREKGDRKGKSNLYRQGMKIAASGITSLEELKRVVG